MKIQRAKTTVITELEYTISGAEPVPKPYTSHSFVPDSMRVTFRAGRPESVLLRGHRALRSGRAGIDLVTQHYSLDWEMADELPDWVKPYLALDK